MEQNKTVLIGMSGGVDSVAAALLLQQDGYDATGCTLRLYDRADGGCGSSKEAEDARAAATALGLPFYAPDESIAFRTCVMEDFIRTYCEGHTPNPCIRCNQHIKFSALLRLADTLGIAYIATGHYARVRYDATLGRWQLLRGEDRTKDQSYVLYPLTQEILSRLQLPLGSYHKSEVRTLVAQHGLYHAHKPDSQDICFVPNGDYVGFLQQNGVELVPGDFVDKTGKVLGKHRGQVCYTGGQRRGLGVSADRPLYVVRKNGQDNTVLLGDEADLYTKTVWAEDFNWVSLPPVTEPLRVCAKTRYSQREATALLYPEENGRVRVVFDEGQRAVTAGQSLVCYLDDLVVGGGIIAQAE